MKFELVGLENKSPEKGRSQAQQANLVAGGFVKWPSIQHSFGVPRGLGERDGYVCHKYRQMRLVDSV